MSAWILLLGALAAMISAIAGRQLAYAQVSMGSTALLRATGLPLPSWFSVGLSEHSARSLQLIAR